VNVQDVLPLPNSLQHPTALFTGAKRGRDIRFRRSMRAGPHLWATEFRGSCAFDWAPPHG